MLKVLKRSLCVILSMMVTIAALTVFPAQALNEDEYDTLRLKWRVTLNGGNTYDTSDTDIAARIAGITSTAQSYWSSMNKSAGRTNLWSDCGSLSSRSDNIATSYDRLRAMTLAYSTRGSALLGNTALKEDIIGALEWLYTNYYNETKTQYGNWFDWEIAIPLRLNDISILIYDDLSGTQVTNYMNAIEHFTPGPSMTAANRVYTSMVTVVRGIIAKDGTAIVSGRNGLSPTFDYVTGGDGFYTDGSFVQHSKHPYTGAYGLSMLELLSQALYILDGSAWDITDTDVQNVYKWVTDSYMPIIYKGALMDMTRGRAMSRYYSQDHVEGHRAIKTIYKMAESANPADAINFKRAIKYWLQQDTFKNFYEDQSIETIVKVKALMADASVTPMSEPIFNKVFRNMDRVVHTRPGYGFGISMFSSRIYNYECINGENLRGYHMGDGMTYLYNSDFGQYSENYWCTVNPYRLPGTTVKYNTTQKQSTASVKNWVGGVSISGIYGTAGMDMATPDTTLQAKKSWFMFDDEIVALGAGISCTDIEAVETIVENRKLNLAGNNAFTVNGTAKPTGLGWSENMAGVNWAHLAGNAAGSDIGYYFPGGAQLTGARVERTGKWSEVNSYSKSAEPGNLDHKNRFLIMFLSHGAQPSSASYSYVLLPGKSSSQVSGYAANPNISILSNTANVQAVKEKSLNIVAANFWTDAVQTVDIITSNKRASIMTKENSGSDIEVAVSDPTQANTGTISVELQRSALNVISADSRITVTQLSPTIKFTVNVNGADGASISAKFGYSASDYLIDDNFNAGTTGSVPYGWTVTGPVTIAETPSAANKSMKVLDGSTTSQVTAGRSFLPKTTSITAEYKVMAAQATGIDGFSLRNSSGTKAVTVGLDSTGYIYTYFAGVKTNIQAYAANTWYTVKIAADPSTDRFDLYIDGVQKVNQQSFYNNTSDLAGIYINTGTSTTGTEYYDDIRVY